MSQHSVSNTHWTSALEDAAERFDGGDRSFPLTAEADIARKHGYDPPNTDYQKLFFRQATVSSSQRNQLFSPHSAGWLVPDNTSICKPVFIAHSVLSAIWLLRETLDEDALPADGWASLVRAAQDLACNDPSSSYSKEPPSAQRPRDSPPPSAKRRAAPTPTPPAKRLQLSADSASPATPQELGSSQAGDPIDKDPEDDSVLEEPVRITTVTNNNRRAERARKQKADAKQVKKMQSLGLVEPAEDAPKPELGAYTSIADEDAPLIAWVIKQPIKTYKDGRGLDDSDVFYHASKTPYATASAMLDKARAIGNAKSQVSAASFLESWRTYGTPFVAQGSEASQPPPRAASRSLPWKTKTSSQDASRSAIASAWRLCDRYEQELDVMHIKYRWAMAFLGQAYAEKIEEIKRQDAASSGTIATHHRGGKGKVNSEAIVALLSAVSSAATDKPDKQQMARYRKRLHHANRWYRAAEKLGWGILCFMPHDVVTNSWVESELRVGAWDVWLDLVAKVNPNAYKASKALEEWLGLEGIAGGSISGKKKLSIEASVLEPATPTQATVVDDSEDDADDDDIELVLSQISEASPRPAQQWRQLTLVELCKPQEL
jgi:hypothetical protein